MNCPKCNQPVEASAQFCGNCGQALQQPATVPAATPQAPAVAPAAYPTPIAPPVGMPAYAVGQPQSSKDKSTLTTAVILAIFSLPGCIIPIVGFALSISAITMAIKHHQADTVRTVVAITVASVGLLLSLATFGYNVSQRVKHNDSSASGAVVTSASVSGGAVVAYRSLL